MTTALMTFDNLMSHAYSGRAYPHPQATVAARHSERGRSLRNRTFCIVALLVSQFGGQALAAEASDMWNAVSDFFEELPVVLTASRLKQTTAQAPSAVTVIDREMIVASGARRIEEVLRLVPGFQVAYMNGNTAIVAYHGLSDAYARRMQVLIDGVSIYSPLWGGVDWAGLPLTLQDIERVEVVRGPNAATYGANAFLAVINIITRDPATEVSAALDTNLGGNGMRDVAVRHAHNGDTWRYRVSFGQRHDDGFAGLPDTSMYNVATLRGHYRVSPADELSVQMQTSRGNALQGHDDTVLGDTNVRRQRDLQQGTLQLRWTRAQNVDDEVWLQFYHHAERFREFRSFYVLAPGLAPFPYSFGYDFDLTRDDIEFQRSQKHADALRTVWGGQARSDSVRGHALFHHDDWLHDTLTRVFGSFEWRPFEPLAVNGALMIEHNSISGCATSPRLAANYTLAPGHTLRVAASRAHRAPTMYEEFTNQTYDAPPALSAYTHGLPGKITVRSSGGLNNETIFSREVGYVADVPQWQVSTDLRLYNDSIEHLIDSASTRPVLAVLNTKAVDYFNSTPGLSLRGAELSGHWRPWSGAHFRASAGYTRIDSPLPRIQESAPRHTRSLLFQYALPQDLSFSAGYYKMASMHWLGADAGISGYDTLDLRIAKRWQWGAQRIEAAWVTRNALGAYRAYDAYNVDRRISYVQLNFSY